MAMQAVKRGWSVRELEQRAKDEAQATTRSDDDSPAKSVNRAVANAMDLARRLSEHLGTKVQVQPGRTKGSGRLIIDFYSLDQFEGLLHRLQYKGD
jgi:ParB-like chromosome segregation protein Spo0J